MARWEPILDEVMRERGSGLLAYARLLTGNDAEAEDVLQDALVRSFSRGRTFTHVNAAEAYVRRAIPSVFIDRLRHRRTRDTALERQAYEQDEAISMGDRDAVLDVRAALATLPPRERACTVLRFYDDLTVPQIAAQLGLAEGTVKRYLADASARLASVLGDVEDNDRIPVVTHSGKEGR
ncbi:sigma-70 family RNA polymerase sigma factor [Demequina lutea]|uniref:RNA polymerase sigma-70 factor (ECF subfamily) n=1 Tax=Demequina lutea TaxID=431489 RepID=A0A7Z0CLI5_9MICO|nr:sigma-70 family RNA polymerase sigma factor [Demequina lutea]NYI42795.1 RNA polymerase sigma-70 factor (ECF subfamily) [Demequina lutea]